MYDKNNIKLAIVDDHPMILEGLKSLLEKDSKFHVFSFTKGAAVIDFIQENKIDVVLLDIVLSDGNGLDFCKIIKQKAPRVWC
ncbi:response regulator transcription factor [Faecalibacter sp. LW9]|uniref:response regulator transcription factor n=1 Tax=Faecalibacter sp. LW9 TaxID=3103144 RepID=UPI002B261E1D|nr:response regulator [Faecalibacter sp. LW9]